MSAREQETPPITLTQLLDRPCRFWRCPEHVNHSVSWNAAGTQATCDECQKQSPLRNTDAPS